MALQLAFLLERKFTGLGARVYITRRGLHPVEKTPFDELDLLPYAKKELRLNSYYPWFTRLLANGPAGPDLFERFEQAPDVNRIFSERMRWRYFIIKAELGKRARDIREFDPHIVLILHFDAWKHTPDQGARRGTMAYVPGSFDAREYASRKARMRFLQHLLDRHSWNASVDLSDSIVSSISADLGVEKRVNHGPNARLVKPGVFSRNLALNQRLPGYAYSFLESLIYHHPEEFRLLSRKTNPMTIEGESRPYSDRLAELAEAIKNGTVNFVRGFSPR